MPTVRCTVGLQAGTIKKETLGDTEKLQTGISARFTGKMPVFVLAKLFERVYATEPPQTNGRGSAHLPTGKDTA